jgi:predicted transcriptional regulator
MSYLHDKLEEQRLKIKGLARNHNQKQISEILGITRSAVKRAMSMKHLEDDKPAYASKQLTLDTSPRYNTAAATAMKLVDIRASSNELQTTTTAPTTVPTTAPAKLMIEGQHEEEQEDGVSHRTIVQQQIPEIVNDNTYGLFGFEKGLTKYIDNYEKIDLQPVSLEADGTLTPKDVEPHYRNIGTLLGPKIIDGKRWYLKALECKSEGAFTVLALGQDKAHGQSFLDKMYERTFVVTLGRKPTILWLSTIDSMPIPARKCNPGYEFEIKTEGHIILPPSIIGDFVEGAHHYQAKELKQLYRSPIGKDEIYSWLIDNLKECFIENGVELAISDLLKENGVTEIKYREPYSYVVVNREKVSFKVFGSWLETQDSIVQALKEQLKEHPQIILGDLLTSVAEERVRRSKTKPKNNVKPKYDAGLVSLISNILQEKVSFNNIWSKFMEVCKKDGGYLGDGETFHCKYGPIYKNTIVCILKGLGARYKHTDIGGTWFLLCPTITATATATTMTPILTPTLTPTPSSSPSPITDTRHASTIQIGVIGVSRCPGALTSDIIELRKTERRFTVKDLIDNGFSQRRVAKMLGTSPRTVRRDLKVITGADPGGGGAWGGGAYPDTNDTNDTNHCNRGMPAVASISGPAVASISGEEKEREGALERTGVY